jgi:hypothetical protein
MMKPCQTLWKESTQGKGRKKNKEQGPKSKQAKEHQRGEAHKGKGTTKIEEKLYI